MKEEEKSSASGELSPEAFFTAMECSCGMSVRMYSTVTAAECARKALGSYLCNLSLSVSVKMGTGESFHAILKKVSRV